MKFFVSIIVFIMLLGVISNNILSVRDLDDLYRLDWFNANKMSLGEAYSLLFDGEEFFPFSIDVLKKAKESFFDRYHKAVEHGDKKLRCKLIMAMNKIFSESCDSLIIPDIKKALNLSEDQCFHIYEYLASRNSESPHEGGSPKIGILYGCGRMQRLNAHAVFQSVMERYEGETRIVEVNRGDGVLLRGNFTPVGLLGPSN